MATRTEHFEDCNGRFGDLSQCDCDGAEAGALVGNTGFDFESEAWAKVVAFAEQVKEAHKAHTSFVPRCDWCEAEAIEAAKLAQVWCDKCDAGATSSYRLTTGELVFRCSLHGWLLTAPRGRHDAFGFGPFDSRDVVR